MRHLANFLKKKLILLELIPSPWKGAAILLAVDTQECIEGVFTYGRERKGLDYKIEVTDTVNTCDCVKKVGTVSIKDMRSWDFYPLKM